MSGEDVIEIGTEASKILVGSFESGVFVVESLQEGVSALSGLVSSIDERSEPETVVLTSAGGSKPQAIKSQKRGFRSPGARIDPRS